MDVRIYKSDHHPALFQCGSCSSCFRFFSTFESLPHVCTDSGLALFLPLAFLSWQEAGGDEGAGEAEARREYPVLYPFLTYPVISFPTLAYPILSYLILSYPILSYPILSYPIVSYPILSFPTLPYSALSYPNPILILSYPILILSYPILSYTAAKLLLLLLLMVVVFGYDHAVVSPWS